MSCTEVPPAKSKMLKGLSSKMDVRAIYSLFMNAGSKSSDSDGIISSRSSAAVSPPQDALLSGMLEIVPTLTSTTSSNTRLQTVLPGVITGGRRSLGLGTNTIQLDSESITAVSNFVPFAVGALRQEIALDEYAYRLSKMNFLSCNCEVLYIYIYMYIL